METRPEEGQGTTYGWQESAEAWVTDQGDLGDWGRQFVLDAPMLARVDRKSYTNALDVGCGEGRFCRILRARGLEVTGIDFTPALIEIARQRDPEGDYRVGNAEAIEFPDNSFDLVVSYVSLLDIPDISKAISEMARVLGPGGSLLLANLSSFASAGEWQKEEDGSRPYFKIDNYSEELGTWQSWRGINVYNWHRPLSMYMRLFLAQGFVLRYFDEPLATGGDPVQAANQRRIPWFLIMEWEKPIV